MYKSIQNTKLIQNIFKELQKLTLQEHHTSYMKILT
jgi:hypothetical protein